MRWGARVRAAEIGFAGFVLLAGIVYEAMAWWMPRGHVHYPGPGFFPLVVGAFLILASAGCLIQALLIRRPAPASKSPAPAEAPAANRLVHRTALLLGFLTAYAFVLKPLGFPVAIFLFVLAAIRVFGFRRWLPAIGITLALAILSYFGFVVWLAVPLPMGIVGELLD